MLTTEIDDESSIVFATAIDDKPHKEETFYLGVGDENGTSSSTISDEVEPTFENMSIVSGTFTEETALDTDETVLASIAYSSDDHGVSSISSDFYENPEGSLEELEEYNVVYLLKVAFDD